MAISSLGYIGIRSDSLSEWSDFATKILAMERIDRAGCSVAFRMDDYKQRFMISNETGETLSFIGWEVENQEDLQHYSQKLEKAGTKVSLGQASLCDRRFVKEMIFFNDPDGNRIELFYQPMKTTRSFKPGRPISGFRTGAHGMGHAVLYAINIESLLIFYRDTLDFKISDYGLTPYPLYFFHVNRRHHSFAIVGSNRTGFHHFMIEFNHLDDVGQGFDLASLEKDRIAYTIGRHTNDYMTSFYAKTPSGFFIENGWGGRLIDPQTWEPHETFGGPSFWGHERLYLSEEERAKMRQLRLEAAAKGLRSPPIVNCPWLYEQLKS